MALERNPQAAETIARQGCDIVDHGWRWLDYHRIDEATEREHIRLSVETIRRLTGTRPIGWYIGSPSANTRRLVVEEGGFLYDSDAKAYCVVPGPSTSCYAPRSKPDFGPRFGRWPSRLGAFRWLFFDAVGHA